jgi:hypothetical protein
LYYRGFFPRLLHAPRKGATWRSGMAENLGFMRSRV